MFSYKLDAGVIKDSYPCGSKIGPNQELASGKFRAQVWQCRFCPNMLAYNNKKVCISVYDILIRSFSWTGIRIRHDLSITELKLDQLDM